MVLPVPDALDECFAAEVVAGFVFVFFEATFDNGLSCDPGVVGSRHPQRVEALHSLHANDDVLQSVVQRVTQVQGTGYVGRRNDDRVWFFGWIDLSVEVLALVPHLGDTLLGIQKIETAGDILWVEIVFGGHPKSYGKCFLYI